jgi:carboxypeptidase family protein
VSRISPSSFVLLALLILTIKVHAQVTSAPASPSTAIISGRVTAGGQPAPFVAIILEPFDLQPVKTPLPRAITNEEGKYRLAGVPEGRFTVKPVAPALVVLNGPEPDKAGVAMSSGAGLSGFIVTVAKGDVLDGIDFALGPGGVITGRVTDDAGRPVVAVSVVSERMNDQGQTTGASLRFPTDDRGIYRIYGLPAGKYLVSVNDSGRFPQRHDRKTFYSDTVDQKRATEVQVAAGNESTGIDIRLGPPQQTYTITGRLVAQDTGKPVTGMHISFSGWNDGRTGSMTTDLNGTFKIEDCVMGNYEIKIATTTLQTQPYYSDPVTVQVTDADINDLEISAIRGAIVSGSVVAQGTKDPTIISALSQAVMLASDRQPGLRGSQVTAGNALIGADGRFEFVGLRPARLELRPVNMPEGFVWLRIEKDGVPLRDGLAVSAGERVNGLRVVVAYAKGSINGQIKVEGGLLPTKMDWQLKVRRADGDGEELSQMIDARGHFWLKNLPSGLYEITAEADYLEIPGVTPSPYPAPIKQTVTVQNNAESQVLMVLDLKGRGK